jgi:radical SAM superfamily enzyme YgiQ (UPF0313 family)
MWSYTRVDTVRERYLELFRSAGIEWLAVGIEAGNRSVRREVSKGTFEIEDIGSVVRLIQSSGINVAANYIFGFPEDNFETMQQTLDLAIELNTEMANMYPCQALPGSPIYLQAKNYGWDLPKSFEGYAFLSYESSPLPTKFVSAADVLRFRDNAWKVYHTNSSFLNLIQSKFGEIPRKNIEELTKIRLRRKLLGD